MKILVTGSEGNIGKVLVPYLRKMHHSVFGIDLVQGVGDNYRTADINCATDLAYVFRSFEPDVVYHAAAMVSRVTCEVAQSITIQTNVAGTNNLIQLCRMFGTKLIFFSTSEVYGNIGGVLGEERTDLQPNNLYGVSKLMGEVLVNYAISGGLQAIIVRPFMFYHEDETFGEHRSAMVRFCEALVKGETITVHRGSARSWMHLDDGVRVLEKLAHAEGCHTVNVGTPEVTKTVALAEEICDLLEIDYERHVVETPLPAKMTLTKSPALQKQILLTGINDFITTREGVRRMISAVRQRLGQSFVR